MANRLHARLKLTMISTFYPVAGYEQTSGGAVTKHYSFGGRFVAVRSPGGALSFLLQDQINSTVYALDAYANKQASRLCKFFSVKCGLRVSGAGTQSHAGCRFHHQVSSVRKLLIADLNGNGSDQAQASCRMRKDADDPGAAFEFAIDALKAIGGANQPSYRDNYSFI